MNEKEISDAIKLLKSWKCDKWVKEKIQVLYDLAEAYLATKAEIPEKIIDDDCCCTACSEGLSGCTTEAINKTIDQCTIVTTKLLAEKDAEIAKYKDLFFKEQNSRNKDYEVLDVEIKHKDARIEELEAEIEGYKEGW